MQSVVDATSAVLPLPLVMTSVLFFCRTSLFIIIFHYFCNIFFSREKAIQESLPSVFDNAPLSLAESRVLVPKGSRGEDSGWPKYSTFCQGWSKTAAKGFISNFFLSASVSVPATDTQSRRVYLYQCITVCVCMALLCCTSALGMKVHESRRDIPAQTRIVVDGVLLSVFGYCVCLSVCLTICLLSDVCFLVSAVYRLLSVCDSLSPRLSFCLSISLSICWSFCLLPVSLSIRLSVSLTYLLRHGLSSTVYIRKSRIKTNFPPVEPAPRPEKERK